MYIITRHPFIMKPSFCYLIMTNPSLAAHALPSYLLSEKSNMQNVLMSIYPAHPGPHCCNAAFTGSRCQQSIGHSRWLHGCSSMAAHCPSISIAVSGPVQAQWRFRFIYDRALRRPRQEGLLKKPLDQRNIKGIQSTRHLSFSAFQSTASVFVMRQIVLECYLLWSITLNMIKAFPSLRPKHFLFSFQRKKGHRLSVQRLTI